MPFLDNSPRHENICPHKDSPINVLSIVTHHNPGWKSPKRLSVVSGQTQCGLSIPQGTAGR